MTGGGYNWFDPGAPKQPFESIPKEKKKVDRLGARVVIEQHRVSKIINQHAELAKLTDNEDMTKHHNLAVYVLSGSLRDAEEALKNDDTREKKRILEELKGVTEPKPHTAT